MLIMHGRCPYRCYRYGGFVAAAVEETIELWILLVVVVLHARKVECWDTFSRGVDGVGSHHMLADGHSRSSLLYDLCRQGLQ